MLVNAGWRVPFTGLMCTQPPYGGLRAIDLKTGKTLWDEPLGDAPQQRPVRHRLSTCRSLSARRTMAARW